MTITAAQETREDTLPARRRRWRGRARPHALPHGPWPDLIARLLAMRGFASSDAANTFLDASTLAPDPYALPDLHRAVERLLAAVRARETVAIFGDFDVDGVTAAAQIAQSVAALGGVPLPYLPDRFAEGYGLNIPAIDRLRRDGATVLVTADCGTSSVDEIAHARAIGMDVIVLDHHTVPPVLPEATALVNPKLPDARSGGMRELATAGLAFHLARALHDASGQHFDDLAYLDLAALGTVCDMAPLVDENRRILRVGLAAIGATTRPGLRALMEISRVEPRYVSADDIGYRLGPRLNAAGRIEHARLALDLLTTVDEEQAYDLAHRLDALNRDRQGRTDQAVALAAELIGDADPPALIMIGHRDFSSGIVGLVAARLVSLYGRPAIVYEQGDAQSRASCRSIPEFHITDALRAHAELFERFGGHRAAAGFTVENSRIEEVRQLLVAEAERELAGRELTPVIEIDCNLPLHALRGDEVRWLRRLAPFGIGNPEPVFLARDVLVADARWVGGGEKHRRLTLKDGGVTWQAIAFDSGHLDVAEGDRIEVVYTLDIGGRDDRPAELRIEDLRPSTA